MANGTAPLPSWLVAPRVSARSWLAAAAGLGCAATTYAGLYPQFDDGKLRFVIALTAAPFGAAVVATAVAARSAPRAFGRAVFYAGLLGVASTILPAAILSHERFAEFPLLCLFGLFFGAPTGMIYGLPLGVLAALGHRHVETETHAANDGASRIAGAWLCAAGLFALLGAVALGELVLPTIAASAAASVGLVVLARGSVRVRRRSAWLGRVRAGLEPAFRMRPADLRDDVAELPRLDVGSTVVEWLPALPETSAYRRPVGGTAVALTADQA